jgi:ABC-type taurine transport system substrate-binding protein
MPSGWKCDLLFKNKIKELIDKYGNDHAKIVKEIMAICGVKERQAEQNYSAIKQLIEIEKPQLNAVSKETLVKKLSPTILLEVARTPQNKQQEALQKIDNGELKTVKDIQQFRKEWKEPTKPTEFHSFEWFITCPFCGKEFQESTANQVEKEVIKQ